MKKLGNRRETVRNFAINKITIDFPWMEILPTLKNIKAAVFYFSITVLLSILAFGSASPGQSTQVDWEPNRYKVECNHGNCLTSLHSVITDNMVNIVGKFNADSWQAPPALGPVRGDGPDAHLIIEDTSENKYASTLTVCRPKKTSQISFGQKTGEIKGRPHFLYYFFAHEMFHVTQSTYAAFNTCREKRYGWVGESLATAVGMDFARRADPDRFPIRDSTGTTQDVMEREVLSDAGGREYYMPLNYQAFNRNGTEQNTAHTRYYRTSGLWRHIAEVYHSGSYRFLQKYMNSRAVGDDWLAWTHNNVEADLAMPFARVYALYMADIANWYRKDRPAMIFTETEWHKILYDGCLNYTVTPKKPKISVELVLQRTSARCIQITANGLTPGQRVAINTGAYLHMGVINYTNQLQLSLASSNDKVGHDCAELLRSNDQKVNIVAREKCVLGFGNGEMNIRGILHAGRIWDVVSQETAGRSEFTNTYVISRVSPNPTDDPENDGGELLKVSAVFFLKANMSQLAIRIPEAESDVRYSY